MVRLFMEVARAAAAVVVIMVRLGMAGKFLATLRAAIRDSVRRDMAELDRKMAHVASIDVRIDGCEIAKSMCGYGTICAFVNLARRTWRQEVL